MGIYYYENEFKTIYERIDYPDIKKFIDVLKLSNYSILRMLKYIYTLGKFKRIIGKPLSLEAPIWISKVKKKKDFL
jgi:hypothetical protein